MGISGNQRAPLTARAGVARAGAIRAGFTPKHTKSSGGFYVWMNKVGMSQTKPSATWTSKVK